MKITTKSKGGGNQKWIEVVINFLPKQDYKDFTNVTEIDIASYIGKKLLEDINNRVEKELKKETR